MSPKHTEIPNLTVCPLTFWQVYRSAGDLLASMLERDTMFQKVLGRSSILRFMARGFVLPVYYHLVTSGYGAFVGKELAGWLYLRGWRQILYIETLAVSPRWRSQGIGSMLLSFAEEQARELHRQWLGLTVTSANEPAIRLYEQYGFERAHWRIAQCNGEKTIPPEKSQGVDLRPVFGLVAWQAYRRFTAIDLAAGDGRAAPASTRLLEFDPHRQLGREWLVTVDGQEVAYLNRHGSRACPKVYLACGPDWWGDTRLLQTICATLRESNGHLKHLVLRLGSNSHHDAAIPALAEIGFASRPADRFKMFKYLGNDATSSRTSGGGGKATP